MGFNKRPTLSLSRANARCPRLSLRTLVGPPVTARCLIVAHTLPTYRPQRPTCHPHYLHAIVYNARCCLFLLYASALLQLLVMSAFHTLASVRVRRLEVQLSVDVATRRDRAQ